MLLQIVEEEFKYEFDFYQINKHIYEGIQKFANPRDEVKKKKNSRRWTCRLNLKSSKVMISKVDVKDDKKKQKLKKIKKNVLLCVTIWKLMDFISARIYRIYP